MPSVFIFQTRSTSKGYAAHRRSGKREVRRKRSRSWRVIVDATVSRETLLDHPNPSLVGFD